MLAPSADGNSACSAAPTRDPEVKISQVWLNTFLGSTSESGVQILHTSMSKMLLFLKHKNVFLNGFSVHFLAMSQNLFEGFTHSLICSNNFRFVNNFVFFCCIISVGHFYLIFFFLSVFICIFINEKKAWRLSFGASLCNGSSGTMSAHVRSLYTRRGGCKRKFTAI